MSMTATAAGSSRRTALDLWAAAVRNSGRGAPGSYLTRQQSAITQFGDPNFRVARTFVAERSRQTVEAFIHPGSYAPQFRLNRNGTRTRRRGSGAGRSRLFPHPTEEDVLLVPYFTSGDEICGFAMAQETSPLAADFLFRSLRPRHGGVREAGLAMLPAALAPTATRFEDCLFIFMDLAAAIRLQQRWCQGCSLPLPIVAARDEDRFRTQTAWQCIRQRERILIVDSLDEVHFRQARLADAKIVVSKDALKRIIGPPPPLHDVPPPWSDIEREDREYGYSTGGLLNRLRAEARPWQVVLGQFIESWSTLNAKEYLASLGMPLAERNAFLAVAKRRKQARMGNSESPIETVTRACIDGLLVIESASDWSEETEDHWTTSVTRLDSAKKAVQSCSEVKTKRISSIVRVDRVLTPRVGTAIVEGRVLNGEVPHRFSLPLSKIKARGLFTALKGHLKSQGVDWDFLAGWSARSFALARAFQPPLEIGDADVVGWDGEAFRFPQFGITATGCTAEAAVPLSSAASPAANMSPPSRSTVRRTRPISLDLPEVATFWAVVRAFTTCVMAPVLGEMPIGAILVGEHAHRVADAVARSLGALRPSIPKRTDAVHAPARLIAALDAHRWPVVLQPITNHRAAVRCLRFVPPRNCLVSTLNIDRDAAAAAGWWVIEVCEAMRAVPLIEQLAADVVTGYCTYFMAQRAKRDFHYCSWTDAVWWDLSDWFARHGRGAAVREASEKLIGFPPRDRGYPGGLGA